MGGPSVGQGGGSTSRRGRGGFSTSMPYRADSSRSNEFAFEPAGREGQPGQAGYLWSGVVGTQDQLDASIRLACREQIDDAKAVEVVLGGDQRKPVAVVEQGTGPLWQVCGGDGHLSPVGVGPLVRHLLWALRSPAGFGRVGHGVPAIMLALRSRGPSGQSATPSAATMHSPAITGAAVASGKA